MQAMPLLRSRRPLPLPRLSDERLGNFERALRKTRGSGRRLSRDETRQFTMCARKNLQACPKDRRAGCYNGATDFISQEDLDDSCVSFRTGAGPICINESTMVSWWRHSKKTNNPWTNLNFEGPGCSGSRSREREEELRNLSPDTRWRRLEEAVRRLVDERARDASDESSSSSDESLTPRTWSRSRSPRGR